MIHLMPADASSIATIIGIDPGSETIGISTIDFDVVTLEIVRTMAQTYTGSKLPMMNWWAGQVHSDMFARVEAHRHNLKHVLHQTRPLCVVCESPFYNRLRPGAYGVLMRVLSILHMACYEHHPDLPFALIDPPTAKKAVGAKGNAKKEEMRAAVMMLNDLNFQGPVPMACLDEHSIDSIAVGYSKIQEYRNLGYCY